MYRALLQNKYLYCSLSIERQRFSVMRINPDSIVDSRTRHRQDNTFSYFCFFVITSMSMNREQYVICSENRIGNRVSHWSGKQDNPLGSFYREAKERGSIPGFYYRGCGFQGSSGSRLTVDRVCHVPRKSMSSTYDALKECERGKARTAATFPSWRYAWCMSFPASSLGRHLNGCILPRILSGASRAPITRL